MSTPYGLEEHKVSEESGLPLEAGEATRFRAMAARLNYLALDRPDVQFAVKEAAKRMSAPQSLDWKLPKRIGRYLIRAPRVVQVFIWHDDPVELLTYVDSDWAGDRASRKSTSSGMIFRGHHVLKSWSSNPQVIALSSGDAELYALTKGAAQTLGIVSMARDMGEGLIAVIRSDSSAALAISQRVGLGKVRHIEVQYLWIQERHAALQIDLRKVKGKAILLTF